MSASATAYREPVPATLVATLATGLQGELDFSDAARALYTSDASNYRQVPIGVVYPQSAEDVLHVMSVCREHEIPVLSRGAGTAQNGQTVNAAVILDYSRFMNRVLELDVAAATARVEPGVVCDQLKAEAEQHGLTWGPDPATHSRCTLGGMIGNNSCGPHSMLAGKTVENILELEVLTVDGERFTVGPTSESELAEIVRGNDRRAEIYRELKAIRDEYADDIRQRFPTIKRRVSGYNLDQLLPENGFNVARALVGSEGTCVAVLSARTQLIRNPAAKQLVVVGYDNIYDAGDSVPALLEFKPIAMEGLDWSIVGGLIERNLRLDDVARLPAGKAWILTELAADSEAALESETQAFMQAMEQLPKVRSCVRIDGAAIVASIWAIREQGASATCRNLDPNEPDPVVGWEDTAVDPHQLGDYLREFQALVDRYGYRTSLYGHFGDGCIHARITFDLQSEDGVQHWRKFSEEIAALVIKYGGSLSGEHGDGQAKAEFLPLMYGERLMQAFVRFKAAWDPHNRFNPGKLIHAYRMDENLRLGPDYRTPQVSSVMRFADDIRGFGQSLERCIGMGKCRAASGAMCPTYQASLQEKYSTRGRAHLLHELMRGDVIGAGWQDEDIEDSLSHCLSCKACKKECPTQVDIASYKAEFMARHYEGKRRPLSHYLFAFIGDWLPRAARLPWLVNTGARIPGINRLLGISDQVSLPALPSQGFRQRCRTGAVDVPLPATQTAVESDFYWWGDVDAQPVVLWSDSFNSHYRPAVLEAAIRLLLQAGFRVAVAREPFCCGRPLYEHGFLDAARKRLVHLLDDFLPLLPDSAEVVVLESSCLSVFRDELLNMLGDDERAVTLSGRVSTLPSVLQRAGFEPASTLPQGLVQWHCHHKASGLDATDRAFVDACFESLQEPEPGCCGMAGAYGMKARTRPLAQKVFGRRLRPALEASCNNTVLVTNGFSCHEQLESVNAGQPVLQVPELLERVGLRASGCDAAASSDSTSLT